MSPEFQKTILGKLIAFSNGRSSPDRYDDGKFPVFGSNGLIGWANETNAPLNSIIVGRVGSYCGSVHFSKQPCWVTDNAIRAIAKEANDPEFLFYLLKNLDLNNWRSGSGQPLINQTTLNAIEIYAPYPKIQKEIGRFIGSIDDRITLLCETNSTLEAIAQALFKSWFVDFDPVHAKQQGQTPVGMDEATAALFPDSFEESELGLAPKGWRAATLASLVREFGGSIQTGPFGSQLHASDYVESGIPVVMPKDIQGRRATTDSVARICSADADRLARHRLSKGDIVFSRRGDVEKHALISEREVGWICGTGCLLLRPGTAWLSSTFLSMMLDSPRARTWLVQHAVGATMPNINTGILGSIPVTLPPSELLTAFEKIVSISEERRSQNSSIAETLATLRDTLLPRLISGQLRLPEVTERLEDALA